MGSSNIMTCCHTVENVCKACYGGAPTDYWTSTVSATVSYVVYSSSLQKVVNDLKMGQLAL